MCLKGFVNCLSHDCPLGIDHDVLATYCWSSLKVKKKVKGMFIVEGALS